MPKTTPKFFFFFFFSQKTHFRSIFTSPPSPIFGAKELCGAFQDKIVTDEIIARLYLKLSRNRFSEKHVLGLNFFMKPHLIYFLGQTDYMARLGAILLRSEVSFCQKNTFFVRIFLRNGPLTYFESQTNCMARFEAKLFRMKTSLHFASEAPEIVFLKNTFSV